MGLRYANPEHTLSIPGESPGSTLTKCRRMVGGLDGHQLYIHITSVFNRTCARAECDRHTKQSREANSSSCYPGAPWPACAGQSKTVPFLFSALMCVRLKKVRNFLFSSKLGLLFISSGL